MGHMDDQDLQELLFELGYDTREFLDEDGSEFNRFMMQQDREARRELQSYIDYIEDTEDDHVLKLMQRVKQK